MMANWAKLRKLNPLEWTLLFRALWLLPAMAVGLRFMGFQRFSAFLTRVSRDPVGSDDHEAFIVASVDMVDLAARRGLFRATCLPRSLTVWWLLRRRGIASELRIGVRRESGEFLAHAWVERAGHVLNDSPDIGSRFSAFDKLSP